MCASVGGRSLPVGVRVGQRVRDLVFRQQQEGPEQVNNSEGREDDEGHHERDARLKHELERDTGSRWVSSNTFNLCISRPLALVFAENDRPKVNRLYLYGCTCSCEGGLNHFT